MLVNRLNFSMPFCARILLFCLTINCSIVILPGCATPTRPARTAGLATGPRVVGEVAVVDEEKRFVLIDLDPYLYVPPPGMALRTTNAKGETAHLKASAEQKRPFIAADILDGDPAVGDQVVR